MITLKTLPQASPQEVFDQVAQHLLTQNEKFKSKSSNGEVCLYRSGELKCAAGCLIGDDEYVSSMDGDGEGSSWTNLVNLGAVPPEHQNLVTPLQNIHDNDDPDEWAELLEEFADENSLDWNFK